MKVLLVFSYHLLLFFFLKLRHMSLCRQLLQAYLCLE